MRPSLLWFTTLIVRMLPETRLFGVKRVLYRFCGIEIGQGVRICSSVRFLGYGDLSIGRDTWIGHKVTIVCGSRIDIGEDVDIAPLVYIGTGTHERGNGKKAAGAGVQRPVIVGAGCWLGVGSLILPGVELANATTVGAGAVVVKGTSAAEQTIVGNPAKPIK